METDKTKQILTGKQLRTISSILGAKSISDGIQKANISRTTFYEWLKDPVFKTEFLRQRREIVDLALHELKTSASDAVTVLRKLLSAENESVRLRTALGMLEHISKFMQFEELEERISELEKVSKK